MYDIFYVSKTIGDDSDWKKIKSQYPLAQRLQNINSYEEISSKAFTKMFWVIWDDLILKESFNLLEYKATQWDDMYVHVFANGDHKDGVCLFPKSLKISNREFHNRFFIHKKEVDIIASYPKQYNVYSPLTYEEYVEIKDDMFWLLWPDTKIINSDVLQLYFSHHNSYDRRENHVFKNLCNNKESYISSLVLCSKYKTISKKEFNARYLVDRKEYKEVATTYKDKYKQYSISSYEEYKKIIDTETLPLFWNVWPEIEILDDTIFDTYFDPYDNRYNHDRKENHVFKNKFNEQEIFVNGITLFSKDKPISQREFEHRFLIEKKEHDILASRHKLYDVVFISYNEPNAEENYKKLLEKCPRAKRVHGVKGIHQAHIKAAELVNSNMFWVVDGDAVIENDFSFDLVISSYDLDCVHVWRSRNPINDLEYGYGGVKLLPRNLTLSLDLNSSDMTTSISKKFKAMKEVSNVSVFNTDEFSTWRSAFRECCKLSSRVIERQNEEETNFRLNTWCSKGEDKPFGKYAILGAIDGKLYGETNKNNPDALVMINNFDWLRERFNARRIEN